VRNTIWRIARWIAVRRCPAVHSIGHLRKASIDTDVGYLLGITRQSAFYLRRSLERRLGKALRV
jgi:hypothetical protein